MSQEDLDNMRLINKKAELIQELMHGMGQAVSEMANREDYCALEDIDQISIIHSAFISLFVHYKLHMAQQVKLTTPEEIERAQEVVQLEDQLNKKEEDDGKSKS
jgi:hypothetical protein